MEAGKQGQTELQHRPCLATTLRDGRPTDDPLSVGEQLGGCAYSRLVDNLVTGLILMDMRTSIIITANPAAHELLSPWTPADDFESVSALLFSAHEHGGLPQGDPATGRVVLGERVLSYTIHRIAKDYQWIFLADITDETRLQTIADAVEISKNIGYIFSGVRHELGNPINSLKMVLSVLKSKLGSYSVETIEEQLDRAMSQIARVEFLLRSLRNFNLFEKPEIYPTDIHAFLADFASLVRTDMEQRGVQIHVSSEGLGTHALVDPRALQQALLNLTANAADALEGHPDPHIVLETNILKDRVRLEVRDNGKGMGSRQLEQLFKPFHTTKRKGTGLGLVMVRKLITQMSGTIDLESEEGMGTTVILTFPGVE